MQLTTPVDQSVSADFYVIDGFDNDASVVASLHGQGRHVGCYLSVGSYEDWRPDAASFPAAVLGKSNGWPGERWLDIRRLDLLGPIMEARLDMCRAKGYDAVDPDNVDGYTNATGFPLTAADQLAYNRFIADAAHVRGMAVGLKNDLDQVATLAPSFDFSVNEQCFEYSECNLLTPFVAAGKPVFNIEYRGDPAVICPQARSLGLLSQMKRLSLDAWRTVC
ncbi:MAG: endo alpha-1,4 polygalactosaminidase [Solirubrobacterales bacterium]|nr:endo alpha-1,4 polygalactosaminidase [Solirubrobacterales bacterium]